MSEHMSFEMLFKGVYSTTRGRNCWHFIALSSSLI